MHYFKLISFLIISTFLLISCEDEKQYVICSSNSFNNYNESYVQIGDTIPLIACKENSGSVMYSNRETHWIVENQQGQIIFESYSFNTYFVVEENGKYIITLETIKTKGKNHEKDKIINEVSQIYNVVSTELVVYTTFSFGFSPIEVRIYDSYNNLVDQDTITDYVNSNQEANCYEDDKFAIFSNLPLGDYTIEANKIQNPSTNWTEYYSKNSLNQYEECSKIELF